MVKLEKNNKKIDIFSIFIIIKAHVLYVHKKERKKCHYCY